MRTRAGADASKAQVGTQEIWTDGSAREVPLYERSLLEPGMRFDGPAVVTQYDATTLVLADHVATVDRWLNLLIEPAGS